MKKHLFLRGLALILCLSLLVGLVPGGLFGNQLTANAVSNETETVEYVDNAPKLLASANTVLGGEFVEFVSLLKSASRLQEHMDEDDVSWKTTATGNRDMVKPNYIVTTNCLFFRGGTAGDFVRVPVTVKQDGVYDITITLGVSDGCCKVKVYFDDNVSEVVDCSGYPEGFKDVVFEDLELKAGRHYVKVEIAGPGESYAYSGVYLVNMNCMTMVRTDVLAGDLNDDGEVTDADAIYLLYATFDSETYPLNQNPDYNGDSAFTDADAIYLLYSTFDPDGYPLYKKVLKILPTPQTYNYSDGVKPITGFSEIICNVTEDETVAYGLEKLLEAVDGEGAEKLTLQYGDDAFFEEKNAQEQGYILTRDAKGVVLTAQSSVGVMYGLMSLIQLCEEAPVTFEIYDRPQIRFRGNMNTLWAEAGIWSYDFGDGVEKATQRVKDAIDQYAQAKLNLMYVDAFGYRTERFEGYNAMMTELSEYARVRGVRMMIGGYSMGYGMSAHEDSYMGTVFRNRESYPDGAIYDCIGGTEKGRSYGTCLSNDALTAAKIEEIREYLRATGVNMIYMHGTDDDQIHESLWTVRCEHCRKEYPSNSLYTAEGAAGAFAAFYDRVLEELLPEFPDLIICPVSPGYAYKDSTNDASFEKSCKFWSSIYDLMENKENCIPMFRELLYQHSGSEMRFDHLGKTLPSYSVVYFSSGDGFYSDKIYTPSAAYTAFMKDADLVLCANGTSWQKATMVTNAEYMWNPTNSAYWNLELYGNYSDQLAHYNAFREGQILPKEIYGEDGLLDASCELIFGKEHGKRIADMYRLRGANGECPIFTTSNVELWTNYTKVNYIMLWDSPVNASQQKTCRARFSETANVTTAAAEILAEVLQADDLSASNREYLQFLYDSAIVCAELCRQLTRYMDLYIEADLHFTNGTPYSADLISRAEALQQDALEMMEQIKASDLEAFDPLGGMLVRREEMFDFVAYCAGQIVKSIETGKRVPDDRRPPNIRDWW